MKVELINLDKLVPYARNPRITAHAVDKVAASIQEFGFRQPIVVDSEMVIIVGHVRYQAAQKLALKKVPVHVMEGLSPEQIKAYRIADNRTGEEAEWDKELLQLEIGELDAADYKTDVLGFNEEELNSLRLSLEGLQDGIAGEEEGDVDEADTKATIGPYSFVIERGPYLEWMEEIRQRVGFDKESIVEELRKRLGL
jgi:ParB-like chromosome segregation protein Spo0J